MCWSRHEYEFYWEDGVSTNCTSINETLTDALHLSYNPRLDITLSLPWTLHIESSQSFSRNTEIRRESWSHLRADLLWTYTRPVSELGNLSILLLRLMVCFRVDQLTKDQLILHYFHACRSEAITRTEYKTKVRACPWKEKSNIG